MVVSVFVAVYYVEQHFLVLFLNYLMHLNIIQCCIRVVIIMVFTFVVNVRR